MKSEFIPESSAYEEWSVLDLDLTRVRFGFETFLMGISSSDNSPTKSSSSLSRFSSGLSKSESWNFFGTFLVLLDLELGFWARGWSSSSSDKPGGSS